MSPGASEAGKRYLSLKIVLSQSEFSFMEHAKAAVLAEDWLRDFEKTSPLAKNVSAIHSDCVSIIFQVAGHEFMSRTDSDKKLEPNAKEAYQWPTKEYPLTKVGKIASEILIMLEKSSDEVTTEIDDRIKVLLSLG